MKETYWMRMSSRRRLMGRIAALGLALAAGVGTASIARADEGGGDVCRMMDVYSEDSQSRRFNVRANKCSAGSTKFGSVSIPDKVMLRLNGKPVETHPCTAREVEENKKTLKDPSKVAACFPIPAFEALGDMVKIEVRGDGDAAWTTNDPSKAEWSREIAAFRLGADGPEATEPGKKAPAPAPAEDDPCKTTTDPDTKRACRAYHAGLQAARLPRDGHPVPDFEAWSRNPRHFELRGPDLYLLYFIDDKPVQPLPQMDEDDEIVLVVIPSTTGKRVEELRVSVCDGAEVTRVGGLGKSPWVRTTAAKAADAANGYEVRVAKGCSADGGLKAVLRQQGQQESKTLDIKTLPLHRFTVGLGLIYDFSHDIEYRAASVKGESTRVIVRDDKRVGISPPVPFITFRPVPVDMRRTRRFSEMFGLSLGISLVEPLDHLYLGLLVEPLPGFGLIGGAHFQTEPALAGGYREGDRFSDGEVPVDERWSAGQTPFFVGLNVDAGLLARVLEVIQ